MKINELFTTLPGILIISGVVLLLIAIILFVVGNKKSKKVSKAADITESVVENNEVKGIPVQESTEINNPPVSTPEPLPVVENTVSEPVIEPQVTLQANPINITEPVVENNVVNSQPVESFVVPEVKPVTIPEQPVVQEPVSAENVTVSDSSATAIVPEQPVVQEPVSVENVTVSDNSATEIVPEKPATIYGGADPLEKTQTFPTVEEKHEPYGGTPEVKIVEPSFEMKQPEPTIIENPQPIKIEEPEQL